MHLRTHPEEKEACVLLRISLSQFLEHCGGGREVDDRGADVGEGQGDGARGDFRIQPQGMKE